MRALRFLFRALKAAIMASIKVWEIGKGFVYRMVTGSWPESWTAEAEAETEVEQQAQAAAANHMAQQSAVDSASRFVAACERVALGEPSDLRTVPKSMHAVLGALTRGEAALVVASKPEDVLDFLAGRTFLRGVPCRVDGVRLDGPIAARKPATVAKPAQVPFAVREALKPSFEPSRRVEDDYEADRVPKMAFGR